MPSKIKAIINTILIHAESAETRFWNVRVKEQ
jgi:hypothetical protein